MRWRTLAHPRYWPTWIGLGVMRAVALLPLPASAALGRGFGGLAYRLLGARRRIVEQNLAACFADRAPEERERIARRHFAIAGQAALQAGLAWWSSRRRLRAAVRCHGRENLERAVATGRPIVLLVGHFVGLEVAGLYLTTERRMATIYKRSKNELFRHFMVRGRRRFGDTTLIERKEGFRAVIRALRRGETLYYLPDQDPGAMSTKYVFADFFGVPTATVTGFARLAAHTDAVVVPCFGRVGAAGGYEVEFRPPMEGYPSGDDVVDARRLNAEIEAGVLTAPEQYLWTHRRFKTRPAGEPPFYRPLSAEGGKR